MCSDELKPIIPPKPGLRVARDSPTLNIPSWLNWKSAEPLHSPICLSPRIEGSRTLPQLSSFPLLITFKVRMHRHLHTFSTLIRVFSKKCCVFIKWWNPLPKHVFLIINRTCRTFVHYLKTLSNVAAEVLNLAQFQSCF